MTEPTQSQEYTNEEVGLALRNHGMHLEGLRYPVTPVGMHYLLIHYDIPYVDADAYELSVGGLVREPLRLTLEDVMSRPAVTMPVVMECSGNGRAHLHPRPVSAPWREEAVGCAEWTGTPLRPILEEAGILDEAAEVVFAGHDRGVEGGVEQDFERSLPLDDALDDGVMLAYAMNGGPLPPQHGFPLRLIVPEWYGMASVKWLKEIRVISEPFEGFQQASRYRHKESEEDPGTPVTRKNPHALMVPPGIPDYLSRVRHVRAGHATPVEGRAWSGWAAVEKVEFSADGGRTWDEVELGEPTGRHAWRPWSYSWDAREPGEYELCARATDASGRTQPIDNDEAWNYGGYGVNVVQRVPVMVD